MNQYPTTTKQLELYKELSNNGVQCTLIGALAARFYGRNRVTKDIDLLVESSKENGNKIKRSLLTLGYPANGIEDTDFEKYEYIRVGGKAVIDLHSSYLGIRFENIEINWFEYEDVQISVASKTSLIELMSRTKVSSEDI